jgi:hypothetical protein
MLGDFVFHTCCGLHIGNRLFNPIASEVNLPRKAVLNFFSRTCSSSLRIYFINDIKAIENDLQNEVNDNLDPIRCVHDFLQPCTFDIYNLHCRPCVMPLPTAEDYPLEVREHEELRHNLFLCQR